MGKAESVSSKSKQKPPAVQRGKDNIELIIKSDYEVRFLTDLTSRFPAKLLF